MDKHYTFFDDDGRSFFVNKNITSKELENLRLTYLEKQDSAFFSFLYEQKPFPYKYKYYRFFAFANIENTIHKNTIIEFIESLVGHLDVLYLKGQVVLFFPNNPDIELKNIFASISDDFAISFKGFESMPLNSSYPEDFSILFSSYLQNHHATSGCFLPCDLVFDIEKKDYSLLKPLRQVILREIIKDSQLGNLINVFFMNNLNISKTAKLVYMHRNTIMNKLDTIKKSTSFNIQNFHEAVAMYMLLKAK